MNVQIEKISATEGFSTKKKMPPSKKIPSSEEAPYSKYSEKELLSTKEKNIIACTPYKATVLLPKIGNGIDYGGKGKSLQIKLKHKNILNIHPVFSCIYHFTIREINAENKVVQYAVNYTPNIKLHHDAEIISLHSINYIEGKISDFKFMNPVGNGNSIEINYYYNSYTLLDAACKVLSGPYLDMQYLVEANSEKILTHLS